MSHALALVREEESLLTSVGAASAPVNATILVSVDAATKSLSFQSFNSQVIVNGTDITLQPGTTPVDFTLLFLAGEGIVSFQTPAAEIWQDPETKKVGYSVNPNSGGTSFTMSFRNRLVHEDPQASYSFTLFWNPPSNSVSPELFMSEDPTILLNPPNS
jgi:hypothetical protein